MRPFAATLAAMFYAAKCYWPGVNERELERVADRAGRKAATEPEDVAYLGALLFAADDLVLCLFEAPSRAAVTRASERLGIPCERVMDPMWLGSHGRGPLSKPCIPRQRRQA